MSTTITMWLGLAFLALAIAAVVLQAWLWGPKFWDAEAKETRAPRRWLRVHAATGYLYTLIYAVMMWEMVPRLWQYQYELPARTVLHALLAVVIGVLLVSKLSILAFFRHFEEAMPKLGFGILTSTVLLSFLSLPYALRAHDLTGESMSEENLVRVRRQLSELEMPNAPSVDLLTSAEGLDRGRSVLAEQCTSCHDMRTILVRPRTPHRWYEVSERMLDKPAVFGERLREADIPYVTAYLVAITPEIQASAKQARATAMAQETRERDTAALVHLGDEAQAPSLTPDAARALFTARCTECHGLEESASHGGDDLAGWRSVVAAMVEEGAEISADESVQIARYLAQQWPATQTGESPADAAPNAASDSGGALERGPEAPTGGADLASDDGELEDEASVPTDEVPADTANEGTDDAAPKRERTKAKASTPPADRANGQALFAKKCKSCHGADGRGDTAYGQKIGVPDLSAGRLSRNSLTRAIRDGKPGTKMKAYDDLLSPQEIRDLVAFVRAL